MEPLVGITMLEDEHPPGGDELGVHRASLSFQPTHCCFLCTVEVFQCTALIACYPAFLVILDSPCGIVRQNKIFFSLSCLLATMPYHSNRKYLYTGYYALIGNTGPG